MGNISLNQKDYLEFVSSDIFSIHKNDNVSKCYVNDVISCELRGNVSISGKNNAIYLGKKIRLYGTKIQIIGNNSFVIIADNCKLKNVTLSIKGDSSMIAIGAQCTWESGTCICDGQAIMIGKDAMISNSVVIRTSDGHGIFDLTNGNLINPPASVYIDKHVWLGNSSRINKGVYIGENSVLGGMSVASGNLKPNSIYAGIPAKIIKENIAWSRTYSMNDIPEEFIAPEK